MLVEFHSLINGGGGATDQMKWAVKAHDPDGIRTRVAALKGPCPRPLDDGASRLSLDGISILEDPGKGVKFAAR